jgi:hypothetical protein
MRHDVERRLEKLETVFAPPYHVKDRVERFVIRPERVAASPGRAAKTG